MLTLKQATTDPNSTISEISAFLAKHRDLYRAGKAEISDSDYNAIENRLRGMDPENALLTEIESDLDLLAPSSPKVLLPKPMLSTSKAYQLSEIEHFFNQVEAAAKKLGYIYADRVVYKVTPKLDGVAGLNLENRLMTRGNGIYGRDISHVLKHGVVNNQPNQGPGELVVVQKYFEDNIKEQFSMTHPRNFIAGYIGALILKEHHKKALKDKALVFEPFNQLKSWEGSKHNLLQNLTGITQQLREMSPYLLDGVVVEVVNEKIKAEMGANNRTHRWMLAIKEEGETAETIIKAITYQVGRTGRITPVMHIEPVYLSDAMISKATGHTAKMVVEKGLCVGTKVVVIRAGEVIPEILSVINPCSSPQLVTHCPACNTKLVEEGKEHLICPNKTSCVPQVVGFLRHFFSTLGNNKGLGNETIATIVNSLTSRMGYTDLTTHGEYLKAFYNLDERDLVDYGFGPIVSRNIVDAIAESRTTPVDDWLLLASFGIRHLGRGASKHLLETMSIYAVVSADVEAIDAAYGFDQITAKSIASELEEKQTLINYALDIFVAPKGYDKITKAKSTLNVPTGQDLLGKRYVVTGTFEVPRDELEREIERRGGVVQHTVNGKTDYVLRGKNPGQSKIDAANKHHVTIIESL